jgi:hypothetical protein
MLEQVNTSWSLIALAGVHLLTNWPQLLGATHHMDSLILRSWFRTNNFIEMKAFYFSISQPTMYLVHRFLSRRKIQRDFLYGLIIFVSGATPGFVVFLTLMDITPDTSFFNLAFVLLLQSYPGKRYAIDAVVGVNYSFTYALFYLGVFLLFKGTNDENTVLTFLAIVLFVISFNAKSLLVLYFVPFAILSLGIFGSPKQESYLWLIVQFLIPFLYWITTERLFPRKGPYSGYNQFMSINARNLFRIFLGAFDGFRFGFANQLKTSLKVSLSSTFSIIFLSLALLSSEILDGASIASHENALGIKLLVGGLLLLFICAFPYLIVRQEFCDKGYLTKNNLLFDFPYALMIMGVYFLFPDNEIRDVLLFAIILGGFLRATMNGVELILDFHFNQLWVEVFKNSAPRGAFVFFLNRFYATLGGKMDSIYPMTLHYMLNDNPEAPDIFAVDSRHSVGKSTLQVFSNYYYSMELPFEKPPLPVEPKVIHATISKGPNTSPYSLMLSYVQWRISGKIVNPEKFAKIDFVD